MQWIEHCLLDKKELSYIVSIVKMLLNSALQYIWKQANLEKISISAISLSHNDHHQDIAVYILPSTFFNI